MQKIYCLDRCKGSSNTVEDPFDRCVFPVKHLKVFNMIKGINKSKILRKHITYECRCEFLSRKYNAKYWSNDKCQCERNEPTKHCVCQENYACNPSIWACECDKYCDICEYLEDCTSIKSLVNDLVVTFDEIADTPETTWFNRNDKTNFWLIAVVLLAIA